MLTPDNENDSKTENETVILDVDGVLNSYSNLKFYKHFAIKSLKTLAKVHGRRKLLFRLPRLKKLGGPNALFVFAKEFCGDEQKFDQFRKNLIRNLDFDLIRHDPAIKEMFGRLSQYGKICIRSDGLGDIASAVFDRVINNVPSSKIKFEMFKKKNQNTHRECQLGKKEIIISGIEDNNFQLKTNPQSWDNFSKKHHIDLKKSVLLDDSRKNTRTAEFLGMLTIHISKLDSLLQKSSFGTVFKHSLRDILHRINVSYGSQFNLTRFIKNLTDHKKENTSKMAYASQTYQNRTYSR